MCSVLSVTMYMDNAVCVKAEKRLTLTLLPNVFFFRILFIFRVDFYLRRVTLLIINSFSVEFFLFRRVPLMYLRPTKFKSAILFIIFDSSHRSSSGVVSYFCATKSNE